MAVREPFTGHAGIAAGQVLVASNKSHFCRLARHDYLLPKCVRQQEETCAPSTWHRSTARTVAFFGSFKNSEASNSGTTTCSLQPKCQPISSKAKVLPTHHQDVLQDLSDILLPAAQSSIGLWRRRQQSSPPLNRISILHQP